MKGDTMGIEFDGSVNSNNQVFGKSYARKVIIDPEFNRIGEMLGSSGSKSIEITPEAEALLIKAGFGKKHEPAPEEKEALGQLNEKVSSTGISYGDANKKIDEVKEKYKDDKYYTEVTVEREQPKNLAVYYPPIKQKVFDPSKLPEPAKTEYMEATEAKKEIENNNTALAKKAGITPAGKEKPGIESGNIDGDFAVLLEKLGIKGKDKELTEKQKQARAKLDEKTASTGIKYKDAKSKVEELKAKYQDSCRSKFESQQPKDIYIYIAPYEDFDPYKIPEPDKSAYFEALNSIQEIEGSNSALLAQGGLSLTPSPSRNYAGIGKDPFNISKGNVLY